VRQQLDLGERAAALLRPGRTVDLVADASTATPFAQRGGTSTVNNLQILNNIYPIDSYDPGYLLLFEDGAVSALSHLWVEDNQTYLGVFAFESEVELTNSVFTSNSFSSIGAMVLGGDRSGDYEVSNCVFYETETLAGGGSRLFALYRTVFHNNIVMGSDTSTLIEGELPNYSVFWDNTASVSSGGTGNVTTDPDFADAPGGDFSLIPVYSAAIDAGNPDVRYNDVDGSPNDIGAYGGPGGSW
jgi:hypothetical protein